MTAVPATVAGVPDVAVMTPARQPHPAVHEAVRLAGVTRLYRMGGAHGAGAPASSRRRWSEEAPGVYQRLHRDLREAGRRLGDDHGHLDLPA